MGNPTTYELLRKRKKEGLKLLYERYGQRLCGYAVHSWKISEDEAWELVYALLFKVCDNIEKYSFESEEKFAGFLFTAFMNALRNHLRDNKTYTTENLEDLSALTASYPSAEEEPDGQLMALLQAELDTLQDWERVLLLLRCQDMPYTEIEKYTGKPAATLKVYFGRLKEKLSRQIQEKLNLREVK